jgi:hypothetical protein
MASSNSVYEIGRRFIESLNGRIFFASVYYAGVCLYIYVLSRGFYEHRIDVFFGLNFLIGAIFAIGLLREIFGIRKFLTNKRNSIS